MTAYRIKALEWKRRAGIDIACFGLGWYEIHKLNRQFYPYIITNTHRCIDGHGISALNIAKYKCQQDFELRIKQVLEQV